jgi:hypothetical protein
MYPCAANSFVKGPVPCIPVLPVSVQDGLVSATLEVCQDQQEVAGGPR